MGPGCPGGSGQGQLGAQGLLVRCEDIFKTVLMVVPVCAPVSSVHAGLVSSCTKWISEQCAHQKSEQCAHQTSEQYGM